MKTPLKRIGYEYAEKMMSHYFPNDPLLSVVDAWLGRRTCSADRQDLLQWIFRRNTQIDVNTQIYEFRSLPPTCQQLTSIDEWAKKEARRIRNQRMIYFNQDNI